MNEENIREIVQQAIADGKICYRTEEGIYSMPMVEFVQQPLEGMLYDINRDRATVMTFLDDPEWVNNLALTELLEFYYNENIRLKKEIEQFRKVGKEMKGLIIEIDGVRHLLVRNDKSISSCGKCSLSEHCCDINDCLCVILNRTGCHFEKVKEGV